MLKYINKDLLLAFESNEIDICMQISNCEGLSYFAGIAKAIHNKFERLTEAHIEVCKKDDVFGTPLFFSINGRKTIINLYSQFYRGKPSERKLYFGKVNKLDNFQTRCEALKSSLELVKEKYEKFLKGVKFGLPLLSSGLAADPLLKAGKNDLNYFKKYIAHIVEDVFDDSWDVTVYYL